MQDIAHVAMVVDDYDKAIRFFVDKLDFEVLEDSYQEKQNKRWVVIAPPHSKGATILLAKAKNEMEEKSIGMQTGGRVFLFLATDDFERDYQKYVERGVEFVRQPKTDQYGIVAVFKDLYGNLWDLVEFPKDHPMGIRLMNKR